MAKPIGHEYVFLEIGIEWQVLESRLAVRNMTSVICDSFNNL